MGRMSNKYVRLLVIAAVVIGILKFSDKIKAALANVPVVGNLVA